MQRLLSACGVPAPLLRVKYYNLGLGQRNSLWIGIARVFSAKARPLHNSWKVRGLVILAKCLSTLRAIPHNRPTDYVLEQAVLIDPLADRSLALHADGGKDASCARVPAEL